ncbi:MAG: hypothetical protein HY328_11730 [Chloroflexi bacterium]|nr:hypothetical protein [Chloroflexota bacterium]
MDRTTPAAGNEDIELYIRTIYSLLRSSGPIRLRSLEESHVGMNSSLHYRADGTEIDVTALSYAAQRLPACFPDVSLVVMGQMEEVFRRRGYPDVETWRPVAARARRRKLFYHEQRRILATFIASVSDIDDMVPTMVAYQIEWNKLHQKLNHNRALLAELGEGPITALGDAPPSDNALLAMENFVTPERSERIRQALELSEDDFAMLCHLWPGWQLVENLRKAADQRMDTRVNVLGSGLSDYRRSVQIWWQRLEASHSLNLGDRPLYFVSSNTHSLANLFSGFVRQESQAIVDLILRDRPEGLDEEYRRLRDEEPGQVGNLLYYASRFYLQHGQYAREAQSRFAEHEAAVGLQRMRDPDCLDVEAQVIEISKLRLEGLDPRLGDFSAAEIALLKASDALILNIDYPLGMAAYHVFSQVSTAVSDLLGVYIIGKAATLNGRVGDVMIPNVVYDEHSQNTFLFRNCFTAVDVAPYLRYGTVFDNQKSVTVRGTFLQNRNFMHVFYEESYTDIEMEAGPYLSAIYEDIYPKRHPLNEIVNIFINAPYDIGVLHYASDTPISRRQTLLSKSLSYMGVDATYATTLPVARRILRQEIDRQSRLAQDGGRSNQTPQEYPDDRSSA